MWSVHTGAELESKGVPTAVLASEEFAAMGEATARQHGYDGMPLIAVPQRFVWLSPAQLREAAEAVIDEIVRALTLPAEKLMAEYRDRRHSSEGVIPACDIHPAPVGHPG